MVQHKHHFAEDTSTINRSTGAMSVPRGLPQKPQLIVLAALRLQVTVYFHDPEMALKGYPMFLGHCHCGFWILGIKFLLLFLSSYGSISHCVGVIGDQLCVTLKGQSRSKIKVYFDRPGHGEHFCQYTLIGYGRRFTAKINFNFRDLKMTLKSHPRSKVMTHFNQAGHGLRATVWPLWAIFTFVTSKWPLRGHPRSRSSRIPNPWY